MLQEEIDKIALRYTKVLQPRPLDKTLSSGTIVTLDSEYVARGEVRDGRI